MFDKLILCNPPDHRAVELKHICTTLVSITLQVFTVLVAAFFQWEHSFVLSLSCVCVCVCVCVLPRSVIQHMLRGKYLNFVIQGLSDQ